MPGKYFTKKPLLLILIILLSANSVLAEENITELRIAEENVTELRIDSITTPIEAGGRLDFSFSAGNMSGPACSAQIKYWFGEESERVLQGNDNFYLKEGQVAVESISLIMPSDLQGVRNFYLEMVCNNSTTLASRIIEIKGTFPVLPQFNDFQIEETSEEQQLQFNYTIESNSPEKVAVHIEEKIVQDNNVVWSDSQNVAVVGSAVLKRFGPILPPGNYRLVIEAGRGSETARISREFTIAPPIMPISLIISIIALIAIIALALIITGIYLQTAKKSSIHKKILATDATAKQSQSLEKNGFLPNIDSVCLAESESSGVLEEQELEELLESSKIGSGKKLIAIEFAGKTPIEQNVKSCIVIDQNKKARFETTVEINIHNNSNRIWTKLAIVAKIPFFLEEHISNISANAKLQARKKGHIIRFSVEKLGAMRSLTISYEVPNLILQEEANSIPLPAVIYYEESEPLVITKVMMQKKDEELEKVVLSKIEIKAKGSKKSSGRKKAVRKKKGKRRKR